MIPDDDFEKRHGFDLAREIGQAVDHTCQEMEKRLREKGDTPEAAPQRVLRALAGYTMAQAQHLLKACLHATRLRLVMSLIMQSLKDDEIDELMAQLVKRPRGAARPAPTLPEESNP